MRKINDGITGKSRILSEIKTDDLPSLRFATDFYRKDVNLLIAKKKGIDFVTVNKIESLQQLSIHIINLAELAEGDELLRLYLRWKKTKKDLQKLWGFEWNEDYIDFWDFPKCECIKWWNERKYAIGRYRYSPKCPVHRTLKNRF